MQSRRFFSESKIVEVQRGRQTCVSFPPAGVSFRNASLKVASKIQWTKKPKYKYTIPETKIQTNLILIVEYILKQHF